MLTEDDAADFFQRLPTISVILKAHFAHKTLLFLGYRLDDPHFLALYRQVTEPIAPHARLAFAVQWPPDEIATRRWQGKIHAIHQKPLDFLTLLSNSIRPAAPKSRRQPLPSYPYKFLDYFTSDDATIFHGREHDAERLFSLILANPLSILYGGSGTGKTSLIQASVLPRLKTEGYCVVYTRPLSDPLGIVHKEILKTLDDRSVRSPEVSSLRALVDSNLPVDGHLVIVLDQFEEFFIRQGPETRAHFIRELVDLLNISEQGRRVHCLLSLRSDYLDRLDELESCLDRDPLRYRMRLYDLGPDGARAAIAKPASAFGINLEPSLLEQLLVDLRQVDIAPPQLQITCYFLWQDWQKRGKPQSGLTLDRYRELGGTSAILTGYLDNVITELDQTEVRNALGLTLDGPEAQEAARVLLKSMITSEQTKVAVSKGEITHRDLIARLHIAPEQADTLLTYLRNKRIIRLLPDSDRYELAHEVMIEKVWEWVDEEERHILDLQDMLARAASDYRKFKSLLPPDRLSLLTDQAARLSPSEDALELLLVSAIELNMDPGIWVSKMESDRAIEVLAGVLESGKRTRYPQIAKALGYTHSPKAIRYLQDLLGESDEVQRSAAAALAKMGMPDVVRPLYHAVRGENRVNRAAPILEALAALRGDEAVNMIMLVASGHTSSPVRSRAANILLRLGYTKGIRPIACQLTNSDPVIRQSAMEAVRRVREENPNEFNSMVHNMLHDSDAQVRLNAVEMLGTVGNKDAWILLLMALRNEDAIVRSSAMRTFGALWEQPIGTESAEVRREVASALGQLGDERAVEPLIMALRDEDIEVRRLAASALGQLRDERAVEPLLAVLRDENAEVRREAASALAQLGDERALEPLLTALRDEDIEVRRLAAIALGQLRDEGAAESLLTTLRNENVGVRWKAARGLVQLGGMDFLLKTLRDEDVEVRRRAVITLGQLGDERAVEPLLTALRDGNVGVQLSAIRALSQLWKMPELFQLGDESVEVRRRAVITLRRLGDERAVGPLLIALRDEDVEVRRRAVITLGQLGDERAVEPLLIALRDEDAGVRRRTAIALGQLGDGRAVEPLLMALWDKDNTVRQQVAICR